MARVLDRRGIAYVLEHEKKGGREPLDVSQKRNFVGYNLRNPKKWGI